VLDSGIADFKASALRYLDRADAILSSGEWIVEPKWSGVSLKLIERTPKFRVAPPNYCSVEFTSFVVQKLERAGR
jgi:hypothetical protein